MNTQAVEEAARAVLDGRVDAVRDLAKARQTKIEKLAEAEAAEREDAAAWNAAIRDGWSEQDLRKVGFDPPTRKAPGRPRTRTRRTNTSAPASQSDGSPAAGGEATAG